MSHHFKKSWVSSNYTIICILANLNEDQMVDEVSESNAKMTKQTFRGTKNDVERDKPEQEKEFQRWTRHS